MQQCAEKQDGPFVQALREKAKDKSIHIIAGYPEAGDITGRLYNSCIFIDDDGNVIENMRKVYAWGKEKLVFAEGKRYPVVKTKFGNVGMLICYDIEYPEPSRIETLKGALKLSWTVPCGACPQNDAGMWIWQVTHCLTCCMWWGATPLVRICVEAP